MRLYHYHDDFSGPENGFIIEVSLHLDKNVVEFNDSVERRLLRWWYLLFLFEWRTLIITNYFLYNPSNQNCAYTYIVGPLKSCFIAKFSN